MPKSLHKCLLFPLILSFNPLLLTVAQPKQALIPLLLHQLSVSAGPEDHIERNDYWLPDDVVPVNYNLRLLVNMDKLTTEGEVKIRVNVKKATNEIILHVSRRIVTVHQDKVKVYLNAKTIPIKDQKYDKSERMFYIIKLKNRVEKGTKLTLVIPFRGEIQSNRRREGLYLSPDGAGGRLAVTQFESMLARTAFPCFDEPRTILPNLKSQFDMEAFLTDTINLLFLNKCLIDFCMNGTGHNFLKRDSFFNVLFWSHTLLMSHNVGVSVGNTPKLAKHLGISLGEVCWFQGNICADTWKEARIPDQVEHKDENKGCSR